MNRSHMNEKPFEYARRENGEKFSEETVRNWYLARAYVLDKLRRITIGTKSQEILHVQVAGDSPLMLSVARQVALCAHFANFDETKGNRTVISIQSRNRQMAQILQKEEFLCNLPKHCRCIFFGSAPLNGDSHIDIELRIVEAFPASDDGNIVVVMSEQEVNEFLHSHSQEEIFSIDTRKAVLVNRVYSLGSVIDNLPNEDIHSVGRYTLALDVFQQSALRMPFTPLVNDSLWSGNAIQVKNDLSNIFCSDCFEFWASGVGSNNNWEEENEPLSKSEHARWVVDKLIMGFRPINQKERIQDERLFGASKDQFRKLLKKNVDDPAHINLCSYAELRRTCPDVLKYDSFLMLSIPNILERVR